MTWQETLLSLIEGDPAVQAAVGRSTFAAWGYGPDFEALPHVVLTVASQVPVQAYTGPVGLLRVRVQVDIYTDTYAQSVEIASAIRALLDGYSAPPLEYILVTVEVDGIEAGQPIITRRRMELDVSVQP